MAGVSDGFQSFLASQPLEMNLSSLIIAMVLAAVLSYILSKLYIRYGTSLSNRKRFSDNFVLLTMTTTLIISVVKSSLALSLGLVGALSIVRFRAAIKEPEELVFLFISIAIGLGLGANQTLVTVVSFIILCIAIILRHIWYKKEDEQNLFINLSGRTSDKIGLEQLQDILVRHCEAVRLRRFDYTSDGLLDASFMVDISSHEKLEKIRADIMKLSKSINLTYLDRLGLH